MLTLSHTGTAGNAARAFANQGNAAAAGFDSETMEASPGELIEAVREQGFESIVAKRRDSVYKPGQRSAAWQKMRVLQRRDFVIGGYTPAGWNFGAILIGDYEGRALKYVAKVHGGFTPEVRAAVFKRFQDSCWIAPPPTMG